MAGIAGPQHELLESVPLATGLRGYWMHWHLLDYGEKHAHPIPRNSYQLSVLSSSSQGGCEPLVPLTREEVLHSAGATEGLPRARCPVGVLAESTPCPPAGRLTGEEIVNTLVQGEETKQNEETLGR